MTHRNPAPFSIQHLALGHGPNRGNWTRCAETLDEAFAAANAVYDPKNPQPRQEIIETIDPDTSEWRFRGGSTTEWSRPTRRRQAG